MPRLWRRARSGQGGGPRQLLERDATLLEDLKRIVEPATLGDPVRPLLWVSKSLDKLAAALTEMGHAISPNSVRKLLTELGFSRQADRKSEEGAHHPDRNAQFEYINAEVLAAQASGQPVISVDTKKKELIGNFRNGGTDYRRKGDPQRVNVHDFADKDLGKVAPYGVLRYHREQWLGQRWHHARHGPVRRIGHSLLARQNGTPALSRRPRVDDHGGLRRLKRRARAALESRVAEVCRRDGARNQGSPLSARHVEME